MRKNASFYLDEQIIEELKKASDKTMISQSKIVKYGIKLALEKMELVSKDLVSR